MATNGYMQHTGSYIAYGKKVIPNEPSGGGSSDFSTAEVTINNELLNNCYFPYLTEYGGIEYIETRNSTSGTFNVVLYKGNAVLSFVDEVSVVYTGNVTELAAGFVYLITGDATITITSI